MKRSLWLVLLILLGCGSSSSFGRRTLAVSPTHVYAVNGVERGPEALRVDGAGRVFRGDTLLARFEGTSLLSPTGKIILTVNEDGSVTSPAKPVSELRFVDDDQLRGATLSIRMAQRNDEARLRAWRCQLVKNDRSEGSTYVKMLDYRVEGFVPADARMDELLCLVFLMNDLSKTTAPAAAPSAQPAAP